MSVAPRHGRKIDVYSRRGLANDRRRNSQHEFEKPRGSRTLAALGSAGGSTDGDGDPAYTNPDSPNFVAGRTEEEVYAASLQFVRKISGSNSPSKANEAAFHAAVADIAMISSRLLASLQTPAAPKNRQEEAAKAKARAAQ